MYGSCSGSKYSRDAREDSMVVPKIEKQQVIGALKATGSTDPDILFAKKEEMLVETKKVKILPVFAYVVGTAMSLTIVGAVIGIPVILFGRAVSKTIKGNIDTADAGLNEFLSSVEQKARFATA
jgi:hypothetical protein